MVSKLFWCLAALLCGICCCHSFSPAPSPVDFQEISGIQQCNQSDVQALISFKQTVSSSSPLNWEVNRSCCTWEGVTCGLLSLQQFSVTKLRLPGRRLRGTLSDSLGRLAHLREINVSFNLLTGEVPGRLFLLQHLEVLDLSFNNLSVIAPVAQGLNSIRTFNISSNSFRGNVPQLGSAVNLTSFNVSNNSFTGPIPVHICQNSSSLQYVDFSLNRFNGTLKEGLGQCRKLQALNAGFNSLAGPIPNDLYGMSSLRQLRLPFNQFTGTLRAEIGNLSNLSVLSLSANRLTGLIPLELGKLENLEGLILHSNRFTGMVPSRLSQCKKLKILNLKNNSLTGVIELNFTSLPELIYLDLASNNLSGSIPPSLWTCKNIQSVSLARNKLSGEIPPGMASLQVLSFFSISNNSFINITSALTALQDCHNLTTLVLSKNFNGGMIPTDIHGFPMLRTFSLGDCALSGQVPVWLLKCPNLQVLDLSWNNLNGVIPSWLNTLQYLFYLDMSNNSLSGPIPKQLMELPSFKSIQIPPVSAQTPFEPPLYVKQNQNAFGLQYNLLSNLPPSLYLARNNLSGTLSPEIGQMKMLHILDFSHNNFSGIIPDTLSNLTNLETLDLSNNNFVGIIPPSLKDLTFLARFNVSNNHLHGLIPSGHQFDTFNKSSFEGNLGLCGQPLTTTCSPPVSIPGVPVAAHGINRLDRNTILGITISVGVGIAFLLAAVLWNQSRRQVTEQGVADEMDFDMPHRLSDALGSNLVLLFQNHCRKDLAIADLLKATGNFDQANIIGCGGFGLVYRATLADGTKIAIKRLTGECGQMEREFKAEVEALSRAQHKNLVSLQGYCKYGNDRLLIYSYMENASLDHWLHERLDGGSILDWCTRLRIIQGAGRGLAYLHRVCEPHIVHRDIKSSNILLDEKFEAHLADFGLSRLILPFDTHVSTELVGTLGYIPPEYGQSWQATRKGDVYSFGVVILELLTRKRPVDVCKPTGCRDLVAWVQQMRSEGKHDQVFDPLMRNKGYEEQMSQVLDIACTCLNQNPSKRPAIQVVVSWLENVGVNAQQIKVHPIADECSD